MSLGGKQEDLQTAMGRGGESPTQQISQRLADHEVTTSMLLERANQRR